LLLGTAFLAFFMGADAPGLMERDEPRYAAPAREMSRGGSWLVPTLDGDERLEKPPLTYWAIASSFALFGESERSARLPSALAALATILMTAWIGTKALGRRGGLLAAVVLATMLGFAAQARLATPDMLFTAAFTAASLVLLQGTFLGGKWIPCLAGFGVLAGLAALAKTPLALLLPPVFALATVGHVRHRETDRPPVRPGLVPGLAVALVLFLAVFLPWVLAANSETGGRLLETFGEELRMRTDPGRDVHPGPWWYYGRMLPPLILPWVLVLPAAAVVFRQAWSGRRRDPDDRVLLYCSNWAVVVVLVFSLPTSKLPAYVLPAYPAIAVLLAAALDSWWKGEGAAGKWARWGIGAGGGVLGIGLFVLTFLPEVRARVGMDVFREVMPAVHMAAGLLVIASCAAYVGSARTAVVALALMAPGLPVFLEWAWPVLEERRCARDIAAALAEDGCREGDVLLDASHPLAGLSWYLGRPARTAPRHSSIPLRDVVAALTAGGRVWAILEDEPVKPDSERKRTHEDRLRLLLQDDAPTPRIVYRGGRRVVVTNVPPR
jgi:4-amino-4-deoxy-L-arabinose transferase-like glycosyltransferase